MTASSATRSGYTIGITIFVGAEGQLGLFENGLRQNVLFLYRLFRSSPQCAGVVLLNHGDAEPREDASHLGIPADAIIRSNDVTHPLDYVIVIGAAMDRDTVMRWREKGTKVIAYKGGNGGVISMEAMCASPPRGDAERYFDHDYYDAIWMTPQHIHTFKGWCETLYRCPVREVPQIWEPLLIESQPAEVRANFRYKPGSRAWRVGIMDPNVTVMKTSHFPMLACEAAYRREPSAFAAIYVSNGWPHKDNAHFKSFTLTMRAAQAGIMTLEPRFVGPQFIANHCDAVVTHHWENGLNYLYYEVLAGDYPLVHNSAFLMEHGYYYPDFDPEAGGLALLRAHAEHDERLPSYREANAALLARLKPSAATNVRLHEELLLRA